MNTKIDSLEIAFKNVQNLLADIKLDVETISELEEHIKTLQEATSNQASWLADAQTLCTIIGVPTGHISDRLKAAITKMMQ